LAVTDIVLNFLFVTVQKVREKKKKKITGISVVGKLEVIREVDEYERNRVEIAQIHESHCPLC
jgi:hypothetical protein